MTSELRSLVTIYYSTVHACDNYVKVTREVHCQWKRVQCLHSWLVRRSKDKQTRSRMAEVRVLNYRLVENLPKKPYYVYTVEAKVDGQHSQVERRYSDFYKLRRKLKAFPAPFPPKRIRCLQPRVLQERRLGLEKYLHSMLRYCPASRAQVLEFLQIDQTYFEEYQPPEVSLEGRQPVVLFDKDVCLRPALKSELPNIVLSGVTAALYSPPLA